MLVLARYASQSIVIAESIVVTVLEINQGQVRIGIGAPKEINIVREEVLNRGEGDPDRDRLKRKFDEKSAK